MARRPRREPPQQTVSAKESGVAPSFPVVGIGASAGGLEALKAFLSAVPADAGIAFIIIQHLDPEQKSHMAELLAKQTAMRVVQAEQDLPVAPDCVYTIPPGSFLTLCEGRLHLEKPAPGHAVRMPIDLLFRSLAEGRGEAAVGIVLSGTGSDGTLGVQAIRGAGGLVLAQDPASAEFDAMPQSAIATGLVDYVLPPAEMAAALLSYVRQAHTGGEQVRPGKAPIPRARERVPHGQQQALLTLPPQILLDHFGASLVLIDAGGDIVSFYGESGRYLVHPTGRADLNLFSMARPRLSGRLRGGVRQALEQKATVRLARVPLVGEGGSRGVEVTITPYLPAGGAEPLLAVIFEEVSEAEPGPTPSPAAEAGGSAALVEQLEAELRSSQAEMLAATVEFEAANEQLRAIHEEAVSVNEELQSTNEELEASKEELQSLNEELTTVNTQLGEKMEELAATNNDLLNLLGATEIATIFLDNELRIRRFTPMAEGLLNLVASDVGRPIGHLSPNFTGADLARSAEAVLAHPSVVEQEVAGSDRRWYTLRVFPYRTADDRIDGVVVTLADVTRLKDIEEALEVARAQAEARAQQAEGERRLLEAIQEAVPPLIAHMDRDLRFTRVSTRYAGAAGLRREDLEGRTYLEVFPQNPDIAGLLRQVLDGGEPIEVKELFRAPSRRPESGARYWDMVMIPVQSKEGMAEGVVMSVLDVTEWVSQRQRVEEAERAHARDLQLLETIQKHVASGVAYLDPDFTFLQCNDQYTAAAGRSREELIGCTIADVFPDKDLLAKFDRVRETGEAGVFTEMPFVFPNQPERGLTYWDWALVPVKGENGAPMGFVLSCVEVTERIQQRERLVDAERARTELAETLNREIAHRVKNNLAMVAGLLELQVAEQPDAEISAVLRNTVGRLLAFADVHEQMQTAGEDDLDLLTVVRHIASATSKAFVQKRVVVSVEGEPALLPHKAATNLAVVANELITNAIKHGKAHSDGKMRVDIGVYRAGGNLRLSVWNSGNPVPADFDASGPRSMGLRLVWGLSAEQYGGTFSLRPHDGGTMAEIIVEEERLR